MMNSRIEKTDDGELLKPGIVIARDFIHCHDILNGDICLEDLARREYVAESVWITSGCIAIPNRN